MSGRKNNILEGAIFPSLNRFALPILLSLILQALYGAVDLWMVSQFGANADISAVATGSQTIMIATGIVMGLSMGITILLAQAIGERNEAEGAKIIGTGTWIFVGLAALLMVVLLTGAGPLSRLLHAPPEAMEKTVLYIRICGAGMAFVVSFNVLSGIFCGIGDSKTPLLFVGIACVVNILGDYVLIDLFEMGSTGAAIATIGAQAVSVICALAMIRRRLPFVLRKEHFRFHGKLALRILRMGAPVALLKMCDEVSYLAILGFVNTLGVVASSGVGIAEKLIMFVLLVPTAYMSAISAFVAQNVGADQIKRARRAMWIGMCSAGCIGGLMAGFSILHGDLLSYLFTDDLEVIHASAEFLKGTATECFLLSLANCYNGYFNGIGKTGFVMVQGAIAAMFVRIPVAYLASVWPDTSLIYIGLSNAVAALFMLLVCTGYYLIHKNRNRQLCSRMINS